MHDLEEDTKSVLTIRGTYYQGWFMYMRYTQGQNEEYFLSRSMYKFKTRYLLSILHCTVKPLIL